jgi:ankyrin repeat protein
MKKPSSFLSPRRWMPLAAVLIVVGAWVASPKLRLAVRGDGPAVTTARIVDAHVYDAEWFDAARAGRTDITAALLDAGYPIDAKTSSGYTAVILAAYDNQPAALDYLLGRGADACAGDNNGNTAQMGALYKGELDIARRLLSTPCPIDQTNNAGETPLSFAVMFGRVDFIKLLIDRGASPTHRDAQGDTPYRVAQKQGNSEAMRALETLAPSGTIKRVVSP